ITRTEMLVEGTLSLANLETQDIDAVLLVGGSTRIPAVKDMLEAKFSKKPLAQVNPDEVVALGAAIQAAMLMQEKGLIQLEKSAAVALRNTRLQDVTNHSFGTFSVNDYHGTQALRNTIIIPKNSPIPTSKTDPFFTIYDGQESVDIKITQGEDENPEFVNVIAEGILELPSNRPQGMEVRVTYSYDANGRMSCEFVDVDSGRKKVINLDTESRVVGAGEDQIDFAAFEDLEIE
ncbi:MAG: Hsp70 family protein, partial [Kiritimatiellae bacterium]|nr:Hsp70 family protein [Kiritimatiellia bacterium]